VLCILRQVKFRLNKFVFELFDVSLLVIQCDSIFSLRVFPHGANGKKDLI